MKISSISLDLYEHLLERYPSSVIKADVTDFAHMTGASYFCSYWTGYRRGVSNDNYGTIITGIGLERIEDIQNRKIAIRPVIKYDKLEDILKRKGSLVSTDGKEVTFGMYPRSVASHEKCEELSILNQAEALHVLPVSFLYNENMFLTQCAVDLAQLPVYEYKDEMYVNISINNSRVISSIKASNGEEYNATENVWIKVEPIVWYVIPEDNLLLCKEAIAGGIPYHTGSLKYSNFSNSELQKFLDDAMLPDLLQDFDPKKSTKMVSNVKETKIESNPYNFDYDEVTEEDIIEGAIKADTPVFIHGKSGDGKSARVKQYDPDPTIIYLRNATPDFLNGKSVYNAETGEMIDVMPSWLKKLYEKCEKEPDRLHILFFDELTNALPSIQGMAFNIILNKEVNGTWKLPDNVRIVAAGNDLDESLSANQMSEPLFNRFAHVYINTTVDDWLSWAIKPKMKYDFKTLTKTEVSGNKIHPAIYSFIASQSRCGIDVLRSPYNGVTPNADPRKWEMASNVLYATGKPEMLRCLVGEDITKQFIAFSKNRIITIDDVLNNRYSDIDLYLNISEKYATIVELSRVNEDNFETIREFAYKLGPELGATFDTLWSKGNSHRLEMIEEIKLEEKFGGKGL